MFLSEQSICVEICIGKTFGEGFSKTFGIFYRAVILKSKTTLFIMLLKIPSLLLYNVNDNVNIFRIYG